MPVEYGTECQEPVRKWHYDTGLKLCYPFEYTGCGPEVSNRFESAKQCEKTCVDAHEELLETSTALIIVDPQPDPFIKSKYHQV